MRLNGPKVLLVEGDRDLHAVVGLAKQAGISWPAAPPVIIEKLGGKANLRTKLETVLRVPQLTHLGLIVDADEDRDASWQSLRGLLEAHGQLPDTPPAAGWRGSLSSPQLQLGLWLMPDNEGPGALETLLLRATTHDRLQTFADRATDEAKQDHGATYKLAHRDKARLHAAAAWFDEPGQPLGIAIQRGFVDLMHPDLSAFLAWFRATFDLAPPAPPAPP
jgi:hypothetical protein